MFNLTANIKAKSLCACADNSSFFLEIYLDDDWQQKKLAVVALNQHTSGGYGCNKPLHLSDSFLTDQEIINNKFFKKPTRKVDGSVIFTLYGLKYGQRNIPTFSLFGSAAVSIRRLRENRNVVINLYDTFRCESRTVSGIVQLDDVDIQLQTNGEEYIGDFPETQSIANYIADCTSKHVASVEQINVPQYLIDTNVFYSFVPTHGPTLAESFALQRIPKLDVKRCMTMIEYAVWISDICPKEEFLSKFRSFNVRQKLVFLATLLSCVASSSEYVPDTREVNGYKKQKEEFWPHPLGNDCEDSANMAIRLKAALDRVNVSVLDLTDNTDYVLNELVTLSKMYQQAMILVSAKQTSTIESSDKVGAHMLALLVHSLYFEALRNPRAIKRGYFKDVFNTDYPPALIVEGTGIVDPLLRKNPDSTKSFTRLRNTFIKGSSMRTYMYTDDLKTSFYDKVVVLYNPNHMGDKQCMYNVTSDNVYGVDIREFLNGSMNITLKAREVPERLDILYDVSRIGPPIVDYTQTSAHPELCDCSCCALYQKSKAAGTQLLNNLKRQYNEIDTTTTTTGTDEYKYCLNCPFFSSQEFCASLAQDIEALSRKHYVKFDYKFFDVSPREKHFVISIRLKNKQN